MELKYVYQTIQEKGIKVPVVVESRLVNSKTKAYYQVFITDPKVVLDALSKSNPELMKLLKMAPKYKEVMDLVASAINHSDKFIPGLSTTPEWLRQPRMEERGI